MTITEREKNILILLLQYEELKCSVIANFLQVSDKTVRNDIKKINITLNKEIILSNRDGYFINQEYHDFLIEEIMILPFQKEKNLKEILHYLFINDGSYFDDVAEKYYISNSTLQQRLVDLNNMIKSYSIKFVRRDGRIFIDGNKRDKQKLLVTLIQEEVNNNFDTIKGLENFFPNIDVKYFSTEIHHIIEQENYYIPEFYESNLLINLLSIFSYESNYHNQTAYAGENNQDIDKIAYNIARKFDKEELRIPIQNSLTGVIKQRKLLYSSKNLDKEFVNKIEDIISEVFRKNNLNVDLKKFINVFSLHIYQLILRCRGDQYFAPQIVLSIKDSCFFIYDIAVQISNKLSYEFQINIPEFEISLIAIHIGFAIEEATKTNTKLHLNIAVFFENYNLIEENLLKNISKLIPYQSNCFILRNIKELYKLNNFDLLITTKNIDDFFLFPICKISPFITKQDSQKIEEVINKIICDKEFYNLTKMLSYYFDAELFVCSKKIKTKKEALEFMTNIMKEKNIIDNNFISSLYEREALSSTGFMNSFALPHSLEYNALKSKIFILINPESIDWGNTNVKIIFLIAISRKDRENAKPLFDFLTEIMTDEGKIYQLTNTKKYEDFMKTLMTE